MNFFPSALPASGAFAAGVTVATALPPEAVSDDESDPDEVEQAAKAARTAKAAAEAGAFRRQVGRVRIMGT